MHFIYKWLKKTVFVELTLRLEVDELLGVAIINTMVYIYVCDNKFAIICVVS